MSHSQLFQQETLTIVDGLLVQPVDCNAGTILAFWSEAVPGDGGAIELDGQQPATSVISLVPTS